MKETGNKQGHGLIAISTNTLSIRMLPWITHCMSHDALCGVCLGTGRTCFVQRNESDLSLDQHINGKEGERETRIYRMTAPQTALSWHMISAFLLLMLTVRWRYCFGQHEPNKQWWQGVRRSWLQTTSCYVNSFRESERRWRDSDESQMCYHVKFAWFLRNCFQWHVS